jgi:hypothetical protein
MRFRLSFGLTLAVSTSIVFAQPAEARALVAGVQPAAVRALQAEVIALGKVTEIEKDTVEGPAYTDAPKDQKATYKIAVLKIEDPLLGAKGLTQIRIGFLADAPAAGTPATPPAGGPGRVARPVRFGGGPIALTAGMEGCFLLNSLPGADFYIAAGNGPPLLKKDENYEKELKGIKTTVKTIDDPVAALKLKDAGDRFQAAHALLWRYQSVKGNQARVTREAVPAEENKLLLAVLAEHSWLPKDPVVPRAAGEIAPSRSTLWYMVNWNEHGFKQPKAAPDADFNKLMDIATAKFLIDNMDKIKLKRAVLK